MPQLTYADWAVQLHRYLFRTENEARPITLFVDDDILASISTLQEQQAAESFERAVRSRLASSGNPFTKIAHEAKTWIAHWPETGIQPALPLLAASVLAAARMARTETKTHTIHSTDYYTRFAQIIGRQKTQVLQNQYAEVIPGLWDEMSLWLDVVTQGRFGTSTISKHPDWTRIGQALSQALFRQSDRDRLPDFFLRIGYRPGDYLDPATALAYFRHWASKVHLSAGVQRMLRSRSYDEQLAHMLVEAAARWDGLRINTEGRRIARIAVALSFLDNPKGRLEFVAQRPATFPLEAEFQSQDGAQIRLTSDGGSWYEGEFLELPPSVLDTGVELRSGKSFSLEFDPEPVIPLAEEQALTCWVSTRRLEMGKSHYLIVERQLLPAVQEFLRRHAQPGARVLDGCANLPRSHALIRGVILTHLPQGDVPEALESLLPTPSVRPILTGGLRIDIAGAAYLTAGEPDLLVPADAAAVDSEVHVDKLVLTVEPKGGQLALSELSLPPGQHEVAAGLVRLSFYSAERGAEKISSSVGSVGLIISHQSDRYIASRTMSASGVGDEKIIITGAAVSGRPDDLPPTTPPPLVLPRGHLRYAVLGRRPADVLLATQPAPPQWICELGLNPTGFEVYPAFEPAWVLMLSHTGTWWARQRSSAPPQLDSSANPQIVLRWVQLVLRAASARVDGAKNDWLSYVLAAQDALV